uniref:Putative reverse transcriptase domain-containing protein n=1 Tax=Tanacetum cinerariifolium TaxID=118510 RepID=A0A699HNF0_TANCI|nr:putative reverse transcriptase domain-containing protein [Tanacetum cinerariifolium]
MAPVTRQRPRTLPNNTNPNNITPKSVQAMIDQALLRNSTNRDGSYSSNEDNQRNVQNARPCFYADFMKCQPLNFKRTKGVVGLTRWIEKMESVFQISGCAVENQFVADETEKIDKYVNGLPDNIYESMKASKPKMLDETIELANDLMDQKLRTYAERQSNNKRKADESFRNNHGHQQQTPKRQNVGRVYNIGTGERKPYSRNLPKDCPKLKNKDGEKVNAPGWVYAVGNAKKRGNASRDPDSNVFTDLMPIELGSFDVIIGMDWLRRCHALIVCDEKLVQIPYGNETLTFCGNESNKGRGSRLTVISCSKAQEYMAKGCQIFLPHVYAKKEEDRSKGKQLEDVPVVRDYPKIFPKDLPGLPPARPVEF